MTKNTSISCKWCCIICANLPGHKWSKGISVPCSLVSGSWSRRKKKFWVKMFHLRTFSKTYAWFNDNATWSTVFLRSLCFRIHRLGRGELIDRNMVCKVHIRPLQPMSWNVFFFISVDFVSMFYIFQQYKLQPPISKFLPGININML